MSDPCSRKILLIEDHPELREAIADLLTDEGYEVDCVTTGIQAMERLHHPGSYCLVLMDVLLPEMDGQEILTRLRTTGGSPCPIVAMSAGGRAARDMVSGFGIEFLQKPVPIDTLLQTISRYCD